MKGRLDNRGPPVMEVQDCCSALDSQQELFVAVSAAKYEASLAVRPNDSVSTADGHCAFMYWRVCWRQCQCLAASHESVTGAIFHYVHQFLRYMQCSYAWGLHDLEQTNVQHGTWPLNQDATFVYIMIQTIFAGGFLGDVPTIT